MTLQERLETYLKRRPETSAAAFVAKDATVLGAVHLGEDSSVFYGSVLRGDINTIEVGPRTNLQDGVIVHLADDFGVRIGSDTTVGHGALIHACTIGDRCLVGMRATILDGAEIGNECIIGAGALVTKGTRVPDGSLVLGAPAKVIRPLTPEERASLPGWSEKYVHVARAHAKLQRSPALPIAG